MKKERYKGSKVHAESGDGITALEFKGPVDSLQLSLDSQGSIF